MLAGEPAKVNLFYLRLCHSGAAFVCAFAHARQVAFLEGHVDAFAFWAASLIWCATTTCPRPSS